MFGATLPIDLLPGDTGHIAHHIELHEYWNGLGKVFNVTHADYGAIPDGSPVTNTAAINDAVADAAASVAGTDEIAHVVLPPGYEFPVTPDEVMGASGVQVCGGGTLSTDQITAGALITFPPGSENFGVESIGFKSPNDAIVGVRILSAASDMSDDFDITNIRCTNARPVITNDDTIAYADHSTHPTTGTVTRNGRIHNVKAKRTGANVTNKAAILIWFSVGIRVTSCEIDGYGYGIQWWGGDANPITGDGDLANERKCGDIRVVACWVKNLLDVLGGGAAIWGSMGFGITVGAGCIVDNCADVGIDFEGCDTWTCSGAVVSNCVNGCLTQFFYSQAGEFSSNTCRQDDASTHEIIARVQNQYAITDNEGVTFTGGSFSCRSGVARIALETADRTILRGVRGTNVRIDGEANNQRHTEVDGCNLLFTEELPVALNPDLVMVQTSAVNVGRNHIGGRALITGNTIETRITQPAGARAIRSYQDDPNHKVLERIERNTCPGWSTPIETIWNGANALVTTTTILRDNTVDVGATITTIRGAVSLATGAAANIVKSGNLDVDGTAVA